MFFVGKLWIQSVPLLPEWTPDDIARVIFVEEDDIVYIGIDAGYWVPIGQYFRDIGTATDRESGNPYLNRGYYMKMENGNIVMIYDE